MKAEGLEKFFTEKNCVLTLNLAIFIYVAAFFTSCIFRFFNFSYFDMDLAVYDQIVWGILNGNLYSSVLGVNFLGHHTHFLAFPIALVYKAIPHPLTLLFLQTVALGLGAYPVFLICRHILGCRWALLISLVYLSYPGIGYINFYEFHFPAFATLAILYLIYFFLIDRYVGFLIAMILTLLCQENMSLLVAGFGVYAFILRRSIGWWLPPICLGILYFIFCTKIIFPLLNPDTVQFISIYRHWGDGYGEILKNLILHPWDVINYITTEDKVIWIFHLFGGILFIPFFAFIHLLPALPIFFQHLLSNRPQETNIHYHYAAELIPFIFYSFALGLRKLLNINYIKKREAWVAGSIGIISVCSMLSVGPYMKLFSKSIIKISEHDTLKKQFLKLVPRNSSLLTTFEFMPHVSHRERLYSFHHVYWGFYTLSDKPYKISDTVDFALIDFHDSLTFGSFYRRNGYKNTLDFLSEQRLNPILARDNIVLFEREAADKVILYEESEESSPPNGNLFSDGNVVLTNVDKVTVEPGIINLKFAWYVAKSTPRDIIQVFNFKDNSGKTVYRIPSPICYRLYPSYAWPAKKRIVDYKYLAIPDTLKDKSFSIEAVFRDFETNEYLGRVFVIKIQGE